MFCHEIYFKADTVNNILVNIKYCWQNFFFFFHFHRHVGHIGWDPQGGFDVSIPTIS